jgi:DNA-binding beta-propeller fold protein YncE
MKPLPSAVFLFAIALRGVASADDYLVTSKIGGVVIGAVGGSTTIIHVAASAIEQLAQDRNGDIYVPNAGDNNILLLQWSDGRASKTTSVFASGLTAPRGVAFDPSGNLYEAEAAGKINVFTRSVVGLSNHPVLFADGSAGHANLSGNREPINLAFDAEGNLYLSTKAAGILEFPRTAARLSAQPKIFSKMAARELAFDREGNLFIASGAGGKPGIYEFQHGPNGLSGSADLFSASSELNDPGGIAVTDDGHLLVANCGGSNLLLYARSDQNLLNVPTVCGSGFPEPDYILVLKPSP